RRRARGRGTSRARAPREREEAPGVAVVLGLPRIWPVRGEPRARRRRRGRGTTSGMGFGAIQRAYELYWSVARLLAWLGEAMRVRAGPTARARSRWPSQTGEDGEA